MEDRRGAGAASLGAAGRRLGTGSRRCCVGATWRGWYWCLLLAACLAAPEVSTAPLSALGGAGHDGTTRLTSSCPPTPQEGATTTGSRSGNGGNTGSTTTVAAFYDARQVASGWSEQILEEAAQALESRGVNFIKVDLQKCRQTSGDAVSGSVVIYRNRKYEYRGLHTSQALVSFVLKVTSDPVTVIQSKSHKKAFDKVEGPKLAALLEPGTPGLAEFERAAAALHPYVSCHVVPDAKMVFDAKDPGGALKSLKSKPQGTIAYYAPYEETPEFLPEGKADEILRFFSEGQPSFLRRLYPHDLYATMDAYSSSPRLVLALLLPRSPEGLALYKTLRRIANQESVSDLKLNVLYINMEDFPMNIGALEKEFGVDLAKPAMGLINITTGDAVWFTKPDLHLLDKEEQTDKVADWLKQVADGKIKVDGTKVTEETETKKEEDETETKVDQVNTFQEDGDFKSKTDKEDEDDEDDKADKDQEEEQATSDDDDDDSDDKDKKDDDDDDEGESKSGEYKSPPVHHGAGQKQSAYMRQFNDGEKVFSKIFSTVLSPFTSVFGSSESSEKQKPASDRKVDDKVDKSGSRAGEYKSPPVQHTPGQKQSAYMRQFNDGEKVFSNIFSTVLSPFKSVFGSGESSEKQKPVVNKKVDDKVDKRGSKAGEYKSPPVQHTPGQKQSAYMRQFNDGEKVFSKIFSTVLSPFRSVFGSGESSEQQKPASPKDKFAKKTSSKPKAVKEPVGETRRLPKASEFKGTDDDKLLTNVFKGIYKLLSLPFNCIFGESSGTPPPSDSSAQQVPEHKNGRGVKSSDFKGTDSDKVLSNIIKLAFSPVTNLVSSLQGEAPAEPAAKPTPAKPQPKHTAKPVEPKKNLPPKEKSSLPQEKKPVEKPKATKPEASKPKKRDPREPVQKKRDWKMPDYGGEDDKIFATIFKSAVNLVTGGSGDQVSKAALPKPSKVEKQKQPAKPKPKSEEPKEEPKKEIPAKKPAQEKKKAPQQVKPVQEKKKMPAGEAHKTPETKKPGDRVVVPGEDGQDRFMSGSDKLITNLVKMAVRTVTGGSSEANDEPPKAAPKAKAQKKAEPEKVKKEKPAQKAPKRAPEKDETPKRSKRFKVPEAKLSDDEPLPEIKPMPQYGDDSDKLITSMVKAIFGSSSVVQAKPQEAEGKKAEKAPESKRRSKASNIKVEAEDTGKSSGETPPPEAEKEKPVLEKKPAKAPAKPKKVYKPVPVPNFKHEEKSKKDSKYIKKFKSNPEDKLFTYMFKLIVSTVTGGSPASQQDDEDGDNLNAVVSNTEHAPEPEQDVEDNIPKAEVLNSVFNEHSYGKEVAEGSKPKTDDVNSEDIPDEAKIDEAEESLSQKEFLHDAFHEMAEKQIEENEIPKEEPQIISIEVNNDEDEDDDDDDNEVKKDDDKVDTMSTEDFISMAFTEEEAKKDEFFVDGDDDEDVHDDDDDDDNDEKYLNYRPFSSDPRKQFLEKQHEEEQKDESLYEHGEAYDRHRQGKKHL